jgi:hypothetical protein
VYLDFNISHGPLEKHTYRVEYGPGVEPGPSRKAASRSMRARTP